MRIVLFNFYLLMTVASAHAALDIGTGFSSFTSGRSIPSLAVGLDVGDWGFDYRGVGVQTTAYSQNANTFAIYNKYHVESLGMGRGKDSSAIIVGAGLGGSYIHRTYRTSTTAEISKYTENVGGPYLSVKVRFSYFYFAADTILGLATGDISQNIFLNFQDMSFITFGVSI